MPNHMKPSHGSTEQQTALRRIATLVARNTLPSEVFAAVAEEMAAIVWSTTDAWKGFRLRPGRARAVVCPLLCISAGAAGSPSASV